MHYLGYELPRISIPRTPVNKGKRKGWAALDPGPLRFGKLALREGAPCTLLHWVCARLPLEGHRLLTQVCTHKAKALSSSSIRIVLPMRCWAPRASPESRPTRTEQRLRVRSPQRCSWFTLSPRGRPHRAASTNATTPNENMRLIMGNLLCLANPGGLLLITRGSFPTQRLQHNPLWGWAHPPNELFITTFFANFVECPECELRHNGVIGSCPRRCMPSY